MDNNKDRYKIPPGRLLIICTRRIGDVLLMTPLIRTFKYHWPKAQIDVLVFKGTESILANNKDIREVIPIEAHPNVSAHCRLIKKIFRVYDLAIATSSGDKPTLYAFFAGRYRVGMLTNDKSRWWKSRLLCKTVEFDGLSTHTVIMNLRLAEALQLKPIPEIVLTWNEKDSLHVADYIDIYTQKFAVVHIMPRFSYKEWHQAGWLQVAHFLNTSGYTVVFTGENTQQEKKIVGEVLKGLKNNGINVVGCLSLNQLAFLLHRSQLYIGPDTVVTHMAAALGIPTIALFGPTNPVNFGPWPKAWNALCNPFERKGSQKRKNVYLIQGAAGACVPCFQEGCERHIKSRSQCLENLTALQVIKAIKQITNSIREGIQIA